MNDINVLISEYQKIVDKMKAFSFVNYLISWDGETEAPEGCFEERSKMISIISEEMYKFTTSTKTRKIINQLYARKDELDEILKHEIIELKTNINKQRKIPMDEFIEESELLSISPNIWAKAKQENDFASFAPYLKRIIELKRKYVKHLETKKIKGYDILLDEYEHGATIKEYDEFFDLLKKELVPFIKEVTSKKLNLKESYKGKIYPKEKQKEFTKYIEDVLCFNRKYGLSKESAHPFTSGFGTYDVRYTNHFYEDDFTSSILSAIHELGHATYQAQIDPSLNNRLLNDGASLAMHESQSRFYENILGRSEAFWKPIFPKLKEIYKDELDEFNLDDLLKLLNKCECSLIRTEADELTYPIHIMIRYEIEKKLFNNEIEVEDLPKVWNQAIKDNLGIDCPNDSLGVLQDIHWAVGSLGYFPTYALGSAYASQIYYSLIKDINIEEALKNGNTKIINDWLKEKIHKYGASKYPKDILKLATNEDFNPNYYIKYLKEKYSKIYEL